MRVIKAVLVLSALAVVLAGDSLDEYKTWIEWLKSYDSGTLVLVSRAGDENSSNGTPVQEQVYLTVIKEVKEKLSKKKDNNEDASDDKVARYILEMIVAEKPPELTNSIAPKKDSDTISSPGMIGRDI